MSGAPVAAQTAREIEANTVQSYEQWQDPKREDGALDEVALQVQEGGGGGI